MQRRQTTRHGGLWGTSVFAAAADEQIVRRDVWRAGGPAAARHINGNIFQMSALRLEWARCSRRKRTWVHSSEFTQVPKTHSCLMLRQRSRGAPMVNQIGRTRAVLNRVRLTLRREVKVRGSIAAAAAAAAHELSYSHSAVFQQLALLQMEVGVVLLQKVGRKVKLTPAGEELVRSAEAIFVAVERAKSDFATTHERPECGECSSSVTVWHPHRWPALDSEGQVTYLVGRVFRTAVDLDGGTRTVCTGGASIQEHCTVHRAPLRQVIEMTADTRANRLNLRSWYAFTRKWSEKLCVKTRR